MGNKLINSNISNTINENSNSITVNNNDNNNNDNNYNNSINENSDNVIVSNNIGLADEVVDSFLAAEQAARSELNLFASRKQRSTKAPIICKLNKYGLDKNVRFGDVIGRLRPESRQAWRNFLVSQKFFFPKNLTAMGFSKQDRDIGVFYLLNSFGTLYESEQYFAKSVLNYVDDLNKSYKQKMKKELLSYPKLVRSDFHLDCNFGIDFALHAGRDYKGLRRHSCYYFVIKATHLSADGFLRSKPAYEQFKQFYEPGRYHIVEPSELVGYVTNLDTSCDFRNKCVRCHEFYGSCRCTYGLKEVIGRFIYLIHDCKPGTHVETCFEFDGKDLKFRKIKLSELFRAELPLGLHRRPCDE